MYCGAAECLSGRQEEITFQEEIINKQLHQIVVIRRPSRLKNHREKKYFFNELTMGTQTSARRDAGRARPTAVSS